VSVKRYDRQEIYDVTYRAAGDECLPEPSENGEFVLHSDYARFHSLFANSEQENARLKAEVERLTNELEKQDLLLAMANAFVTDWNAAKGVQS